MSFPTSIWTTIRALRKDPERVKDEVVRRYSAPVCEFIRKQGFSPEDSEDLTQDVFLRVCSEEFLEKVDPRKGRFRALLLAVTRNVTAAFRRRELGPTRDRRKTVALEGFDIPVEAEADPDFDRLWTKNLMAQAMRRMRSDTATSALKLQLEGRKYGEIALRLSKSETEVTNYIHRAKKRLRAQIESLIREYSGDDQVRAEIADLVKYL